MTRLAGGRRFVRHRVGPEVETTSDRTFRRGRMRTATDRGAPGGPGPVPPGRWTFRDRHRRGGYSPRVPAPVTGPHRWNQDERQGSGRSNLGRLPAWRILPARGRRTPLVRRGATGAARHPGEEARTGRAARGLEDRADLGGGARPLRHRSATVRTHHGIRVIASPGEVALDDLVVGCGVEPELCVTMGSDLRGPGVTTDEARAAVARHRAGHGDQPETIGRGDRFRALRRGQPDPVGDRARPRIAGDGRIRLRFAPGHHVVQTARCGRTWPDAT